MKIIIAGAGEVGFHLAKQLSGEEHDITVIDIDSAHLSRVDSSIDVLTVNGSSTAFNTLKRANVSETELLVAVTSLESININTAIIAKKMGAKRTIARVSNGEYVTEDSRQMFKELGIDYLIYPEELASLEIVKLIQRAAATDIIEFEEGRLTLIGIRLDTGTPVLNKTLREVASEFESSHFRIVAIQRGMRTLIPSGNDKFIKNDQVFIITTPNGIEDILKISGKDTSKISDIMILGGGKIGRKTAKMLEDSINIKLVESNVEKTLDLADYLQKSLVIQGDGRDIDLLAQEGIVDMDAFIAVTSDAETNIISCLMAKHLGVSKSIALVDNVDYIPLTQTIGLDSLINKKLIAANNISRFIRKSNIITVATLQGIDAEVLEYVAKPGTQIVKYPIKKLKFPTDALIGGYVRNNQGYIAMGDSQIEPNDKVVIFAIPSAISKIEKYFK
ncbi:MAG: Trk system potassium transporter TrkA [Ignavibacteria bacterium]|jgi:trk system potassium uptake protein TrkA